MRQLKLWAVITGALLWISCSEPFYIPEGDPQAGRQAFLDLGCFSCHRVKGEDFPPPPADPPVPIILGQNWSVESREDIAQAILAPSHSIARYRRFVKSGNLSRMGTNENMTLKQWIDVVSYLDELRTKR